MFAMQQSTMSEHSRLSSLRMKPCDAARMARKSSWFASRPAQTTSTVCTPLRESLPLEADWWRPNWIARKQLAGIFSVSCLVASVLSASWCENCSDLLGRWHDEPCGCCCSRHGPAVRGGCGRDHCRLRRREAHGGIGDGLGGADPDDRRQLRRGHRR